MRVFLILLCCAVFPLTAAAQQAIVNLPSADITPEGAYFGMHETQARPNEPGRYWYMTNFFAYGVGKNTELAVTSYNHGTPATPNASIGVGFKSSIPFFEETQPKREYKLTVGQMTIFNTSRKAVGLFVYSHGNFRLPKLNTRLSAGISAGTSELFKRDTVHFIGGVEHPLMKDNKVVLLTEWFAGRHDFGFVTPGVLYHPTKRIILVAAYKIPNHPENGRAGFIGEFGFIIGGKKDNQKPDDPIAKPAPTSEAGGSDDR